MLYIKEKDGQYSQAPEDRIFAEANSICISRLEQRERINSSHDAIQAMEWRMRQCKVEVFACLFLSSSHSVIAYEEICSGTINLNAVYPREVVKAAFRHDAAAVIFAHNHPSGEPTPSKEDIDLTKKLKELLEPLRVRVLDHLVVGNQVTSFADHGLLN